METWGAGSFENVVAQLWLIKLVDGSEVEPLVRALEAVHTESGPVSSALACKAVAAAELVASLNPESRVTLPDEIADWFKRKNYDPAKNLLISLNKPWTGCPVNRLNFASTGRPSLVAAKSGYG